MSGPLAIGVQTVISCMWVLEIEWESSGIAVRAVKSQAISPAPRPTKCNQARPSDYRFGALH